MRILLLITLVMDTIASYDVSNIPEIPRASFQTRGGVLRVAHFTEGSSNEEGFVFSVSIPVTYQGKPFRQVMFASDRNDLIGSSLEVSSGAGPIEFQVKVTTKNLDKPVLILVCGTDLAAIRAGNEIAFGYLDLKKLTIRE